MTKTIAVVTINTESRPASRGSRGEFDLGLLWSSSPTFSSDGTSLCVGLAGPWPGAEVRGSAVVGACVEAVASDSGCCWMVEAWVVELVPCAVWADGDEKVVRGSVVSGDLLSAVEMDCGEVELSAVGVAERLSPGAEGEAVVAFVFRSKGTSLCW